WVPPAGGGQTSATSSGSGGGAIGVGANRANVTNTQSVSAYVGASSLVVAGGNVSITSSGTTNMATSSKNATGGIVGIGHADTTITQTNTSSVYIAGNARIVTGASFTMNATNSSNGFASTTARGGGGIGVANAESTTIDVAYTTTAQLQTGAEIFATGAVAVTSSSSVNITTDSDANGLGFGADAHSDAFSWVGHDHDAQTRDAKTQTELQTGSRITGNSVKLGAFVPQMYVHANSESKGAGFYSEGIDEAEAQIDAAFRIDAPLATGSAGANGHVRRRSLAAGGGREHGGNLTPESTVDFSSDVIINSGRIPTLVIAADGSVAVRVEIPTLSIGGGVIS